MDNKLLIVLPAAGKQLSRCCVCFGGGRKERSGPRRGSAEARAPAAMRTITVRKRDAQSEAAGSRTLEVQPQQ